MLTRAASRPDHGTGGRASGARDGDGFSLRRLGGGGGEVFPLRTDSSAAGSEGRAASAGGRDEAGVSEGRSGARVGGEGAAAARGGAPGMTEARTCFGGG